MGIQFDLIIPPIIFGFIILLILRINSFMLSTSVDSRLTHEMQNFADVAAVVIHDELRSLNSIENITASSVRFTNTASDTVEIFRNQRNLNIVKISAGFPADTLVYPARLSNLTFEEIDVIGTIPTFLRVRVTSESVAQEEAGNDDGRRVRAFAEKQIYLRNLHM